MNTVLRGVRWVLIIGTATAVVIVGVLAPASAYPFGFTTITAGPTESAYVGINYSASGTHPVGVVRISPEEDDAPSG